MRVVSVRENPPGGAVAYHGQLAADWEKRYQKRSFRERVHALEEILAGRDLNGMHWVDAGCGTGTLSRFLVQRGCRVLGVDAAQGMLNEAKHLVPAEISPSLQFARVETIAHLPVSDGSQDGVLCSSVLEYVEDPGECLAEFARALRPGGLLAVSVPNAGSVIRRAQVSAYRVGKKFGLNWVRFVQYSHHDYTLKDFNRLLAQYGFAAEKALCFGSPIPRWLQRKPYGGSLLMFLAVREPKTA